MSWSELERLVETAEQDPGLRRALAHCRSRHELLLACLRLGYRIEAEDLRLARALERPPAPGQGRPVAPPLQRECWPLGA